MKTFAYLFICFWSVQVMAQNDSIPKKNKEPKMYFGAYVSIGLNRYYVASEFITESHTGSYQNIGLMIDVKLYKKLWLQLDANHSFNREGRINFKKDSFDTDIVFRKTTSGETNALVYIKYQIYNKSKWNIFIKSGIGFGFFSATLGSKYSNIAFNQIQGGTMSIPMTNTNYYTLSTGFDINYSIKQHFILFSQLLFNSGINSIFEKTEYFDTGNLGGNIHIETLIPQTLIYSLGVKF